MNARLLPSIKQMTTFFSVAILSVTAMVFTLRLTVFNNVVNDPLIPMTAVPSTLEMNGESFEYKMNATIEFPSATERGIFNIENPETNSHYMRVEIIRSDTGKSIYYSGYITPGEKMKTAGLQGDPLKSGTYACKAIVTAYDPDSKTATGSEEQAVTVVIGEKKA